MDSSEAAHLVATMRRALAVLPRPAKVLGLARVDRRGGPRLVARRHYFESDSSFGGPGLYCSELGDSEPLVMSLIGSG